MGDVSTFLQQFATWAADREDVRAVGLAGSWARGTATLESDVDLVVIVEDIHELLDDDGWPARFGKVASTSTEDWGLLQSRRVHYADGREVEFGLTTTEWAALPLDPGTRQVVADGFEILYDPDGLLQRCMRTGAEREPPGAPCSSVTTVLRAKDRVAATRWWSARVAIPTDEPLSLVALDLDAFKQINDTHGHAAGDITVIAASHAWSGQLRAGDTLARTGGDEFIAVLPGAGADQAIELAARLQDATSATVSCSVGVATWTSEQTAEALVTAADRALYRDKARRRNDAWAGSRPQQLA